MFDLQQLHHIPTLPTLFVGIESDLKLDATRVVNEQLPQASVADVEVA